MVTFRGCVLDSVISPGLTGGRVPWTTDVPPNETKLTVMKIYLSSCFKSSDTDGLRCSA